MLPQTFAMPGRRHPYVDLQDLFEMYDLSGRFRDWIRRTVKPLLGSAVVEYHKEGTDLREKNYCIAAPNAHALIATLPEDKRETQAANVVTPATPAQEGRQHFRLRLPMHGLSHNAMYEPTSFGARRQLRRSAEYNEWAEVFQSHVPAKPRWLKKNRNVHLEIKFGHTQPFDTENLMKSAIDTLFSTWRLNDNYVRSGAFSSEIVRGKSDGYILIDVYQ